MCTKIIVYCFCGRLPNKADLGEVSNQEVKNPFGQEHSRVTMEILLFETPFRGSTHPTLTPLETRSPSSQRSHSMHRNRQVCRQVTQVKSPSLPHDHHLDLLGAEYHHIKYSAHHNLLASTQTEIPP